MRRQRILQLKTAQARPPVALELNIAVLSQVAMFLISMQAKVLGW